MGVSFIGLIVILLVVVLPIVLGVVLIACSRGKSLGYPACGQCQYDLSGTIGTATRCPECGAEFATAGILSPKTRRSRSMLWGGIVLVLVPVIFFGMPMLMTMTFSMSAAQRRAVAAQAQAQVAAAQAPQQANQPAPQPTAPDAKAPTAKPAEGLPVKDILIGGDEQKRYALIGPAADANPPADGWALLVVFPGGEGGIDFLPFVRRLAERAVPEGVLVAMAVAPRWRDDENRIVWPTRRLPDEQMAFPAEEFAEAIVGDVKTHAPINERRIFAMGWSSGGPAVYATLYQEKTAFSGAFVAMSVFKPEQLPPAAHARDRAFYLLHSPQDFIPMRFPEAARDALAGAGAHVTLATYEGGHGWHGNPYQMIRAAIDWLLEHVAAPEPN